MRMKTYYLGRGISEGSPSSISAARLCSPYPGFYPHAVSSRRSSIDGLRSEQLAYSGEIECAAPLDAEWDTGAGLRNSTPHGSVYTQ